MIGYIKSIIDFNRLSTINYASSVLMPSSSLRGYHMVPALSNSRGALFWRETAIGIK
jgi:hypothetical protein